MRLWETLARKTALDLGRFLSVQLHRVALPDGQIIEEWPWIVTPDYVNIVPITAQGECLLFRQTKYAATGVTLALAGGYLEAGESPLAAARRELQEEFGYEARRWQALGSFAVDGNRGCGTAHLFLALDAFPAPRADEHPSDDLEDQDALLMPLDRVRQALFSGEFQVLPWVAALALALAFLDDRDLPRSGTTSAGDGRSTEGKEEP